MDIIITNEEWERFYGLRQRVFDLIEKIDDCEEELLYDILDYSETYRYVSCKSHKCYALFLPSVYLELFIKNFYEVNYE